MAWRRVFREYFTFNRRERRSSRALLVLLCALFIVHLSLRLWPVEVYQISQEDKDRFEFISSRIHTVEETNSNYHDEVIKSNEAFKKPLSRFDPNEVSVHEFIELGLDSFTAQRINKYRQHGGRFKKAADLYKIYGIDSSWVSLAIPFVELKRFEPTAKTDKRRTDSVQELDSAHAPAAIKQPMNLNLVDSISLVSIRGIGPFYARQIIAERNRLGGFVSYLQLIDLYQMRDEAMEALVEHTFIDSSDVVQININHCTIEELGRHPYLSWKQARIIINYREKHGPFRTLEDLKNTQVVSDSIISKIAPYISTDVNR